MCVFVKFCYDVFLVHVTPHQLQLHQQNQLPQLNEFFIVQDEVGTVSLEFVLIASIISTIEHKSIIITQFAII